MTVKIVLTIAFLTIIGMFVLFSYQGFYFMTVGNVIWGVVCLSVAALLALGGLFVKLTMDELGK